MSYSRFLYVANKVADFTAGAAASAGAYFLANARIVEHSVCSGVGATTAFFMNVMASLNYLESRSKYLLPARDELREAYAKKQTQLKWVMGTSMGAGFIALVVLAAFFYKDIEHMGTDAKTEEAPLSSAIATVIVTALPHFLRMTTECVFDLYFAPTETELLEPARQQLNRSVERSGAGAEECDGLAHLLTTTSLFMGFSARYLGERVPRSRSGSSRAAQRYTIERVPS